MPPALSSPSARRPTSRGFTLVEILTVIAVIGILATILFPLVGKAQENARKAKTRVQFSQWASAIEAFRQEYGFYPSFPTQKVNGAVGTPNVLFLELLSGRGTGTGTPPGYISTEGTNPQNRKRIPFYSFGNSDVQGATTIVDAFGNSDITVLVDSDYDGFILEGVIKASSANVQPPEGGGSFRPPDERIPATGVRAGVIFFSAGKGTGNQDVVTTWY